MTRNRRKQSIRTILEEPVSGHSINAAIFLLLCSRLRQTTGQIMSADGRLHAAFLR